MIKIPSPDQNFVSTFDNGVSLLYSNLLTRKTTELGFDVFIPNVDLSLSFKNHLNSIIVTQDIAKILQGVEAMKTYFFLVLFAFPLLHFHILFKPLQTIINHPNIPFDD